MFIPKVCPSQKKIASWRHYFWSQQIADVPLYICCFQWSSAWNLQVHITTVYDTWLNLSSTGKRSGAFLHQSVSVCETFLTKRKIIASKRIWVALNQHLHELHFSVKNQCLASFSLSSRMQPRTDPSHFRFIKFCSQCLCLLVLWWHRAHKTFPDVSTNLKQNVCVLNPECSVTSHVVNMLYHTVTVVQRQNWSRVDFTDPRLKKILEENTGKVTWVPYQRPLRLVFHSLRLHSSLKFPRK